MTQAVREAPIHVPEAPARAGRLRRVLAAIAGPGLIAVSVLIALRGFAFADRLTNQHPDVLAFVLPRLSFLGRSLAAGHIPLWNPFDMSGTPYAADPQSGWLYVPPMALFAALSPGAAMRAYIVFNPLLAGLASYWLLRREGLRRVAATAGALSLAMLMSTSVIAVSMPFAGTIAWTMVVLVAASGYVRALGPRRIPWLALGAFAWGQVASAHMSHGLAMCSALVLTYLVGAMAREVRAGRLRLTGATALVLGFAAFLLLANFAIVLPRVALVARSSLRAGYDGLGVPLARAAGIDGHPIMSNGVWTGWPLSIGGAPGAYAGAAILLALPAVVRARRQRALAGALLVVAGLAYVATWSVLIEAHWFRDLVLRLPYGDLYLHNPGRLRYVWFTAAPLLGAIGLQGLLERPLPWRRAVVWIGSAAAVFLALPLVLGAHPVRLTMLAIGALVVAPIIVALATGRRWAAGAVIAVLAIELLGSAVYSQAYEGGTVFYGLENGAHPNLVPQPLRWPEVDSGRFLEPGRFARILAGVPDRYLSWIAPDAAYPKAYLFRQGPRSWPALVNERGTLFEAHDALGYNPVQLPRYWSYIRVIDPEPVFYNASVVNQPTLQRLRMLGVRYLVVKRTSVPPVPGPLVSTEGDFAMYEVDGWQPRASVVGRWEVVDRAVDALRAIIAPDFDPASEAVVEDHPGIEPDPEPTSGTAVYREATPEDVRVAVDTTGPALLLIRTNWDRGWSATVDGSPAPVLRGDYFRQAVPLPAGRHEVRLVYGDPWIGRGLLVSGGAWIALAALWVALRVRERRRIVRLS